HRPVVPYLLPEISVHLACALPGVQAVEYVPWLTPLFTSPLQIENGQVIPPNRPGHGWEGKPEMIARLRAEPGAGARGRRFPRSRVGLCASSRRLASRTLVLDARKSLGYASQNSAGADVFLAILNCFHLKLEATDFNLITNTKGHARDFGAINDDA